MSLFLDHLAFNHCGSEVRCHLKIPAAYRTAFVAPPGSAKSKFLNVIAGFEPNTGGNIFWEKQCFDRMLPADRPLSIVFSKDNLFDHLTLFDNILLGLRGTLQTNLPDRQRVMELIDFMGLRRLLNVRVSTLSQAEQYRAAVARAILRRKPLLLLDNPFWDLAESEQSFLKKQLCAIQKVEGMIIFFTANTLAETENFSDLLLAKRQNQIVFSWIAPPVLPQARARYDRVQL
jgi:thiamine transport system ATP-binding protein